MGRRLGRKQTEDSAIAQPIAAWRISADTAADQRETENASAMVAHLLTTAAWHAAIADSAARGVILSRLVSAVSVNYSQGNTL